MKLICAFVIFLHDWQITEGFLFRPSLQPIAETTNWNAPWVEYQHDPNRFKAGRPRVTDEGVELPPNYATPDFREPESPRLLFKHHFYHEIHRPYRLSPHYKTTSNYAYYNPLGLNETCASCNPWDAIHLTCHVNAPMTRGRPRVTDEGLELPPAYATPDFREPESPRHIFKHHFYHEIHRPYRLSPHYKTTSNYAYYNPLDDIEYAGCYCTTVYRRLTPLAGCALITTRHILTTATSTWLVVRDRRHFQVLEDILGAWYDTNHDVYNSSLYISPARIHFHPQWHYPEQVNRSHPFSFSYDLSVWALTHTVWGWYFLGSSAIVCMRATSVPSWWEGPTPRDAHKLRFLIVGFQMMWGYNRIPDPFHKYVIRTDRFEEPCPKTEWGWFICLPAMDYAKFGIESGAALHRYDKSWRYNGLVAMGAFSMQLRSVDMVHYFTIIDCHPVLDFLYDAYESNLQYVWLDARFYDSKHMAPVPKPGYYIEKRYTLGEQRIYDPIHIN